MVTGDTRIALLGVGSMGGAILAGLRSGDSEAGVPERSCHPIAVTCRTAESAAAFDGVDGVIAYANEADAEANRRAVRGAELVILAVKPQLVGRVLAEIAEDLDAGATLVSVAAGVTTAHMEALLPAGVQVVRAMPNTPAQLGLGVTGVAAGASASEAAVAAACRVFRAVGEVLVVREDQIDAVTAVSGSGPAYLFLYTEAMTAAAERVGFDRDQASLLAQQTVIGAAALMRRSGEDPATLRRRVTSPKGTTEQAIRVLQDAQLEVLFERAFAANMLRARQLERPHETS